MEKRICSACGRELTQEQDFCPDCGHPAKVAAAPAQSAAPAQNAAPNPVPAAAPQPSPYPQPAVPALSGKTGKGMGWIVFLRVIFWILFAAIVVTAFVMAVPVFYGSPILAVLIVLGGILVGFIVVAGGMVALNNATNLRSIAKNTALTVELLQRLNNKK